MYQREKSQKSTNIIKKCLEVVISCVSEVSKFKSSVITLTSIFMKKKILQAKMKANGLDIYITQHFN